MPPDVHLINPLRDHTGGSEHRTLTLYRLLQQAQVGHTWLWSAGNPHGDIAAIAPVTQINAPAGVYPRDGVLVFIGVYYPFGDWLRDCTPSRIVVIVNLLDPPKLQANLATLRHCGHHDVEVVFTSVALQRAMGGQGRVLYSLIDTNQFPAVPAITRSFTVGRLSRDLAVKHHSEDVIVYQDVLARGGAVSLMGAGTLHPQPRPSANFISLPAGSESAAQFLSRLDCFFYRTAPEWFETFGRVVHEAMCSGLPVLCHRGDGAAEHIEHGVNGLLFDTTGEALHGLDQLRGNTQCRLKLGAAARQTMLDLHGNRLRQQTLEFLLR